MVFKRTALAMMTASILSACGGGDDPAPAPGGNDPPPPTPSVGVFVDSPVAGIHYQTATQSGETDANGRFNYLPGETVTFSLGGITLPAVAASDTVTPLTVFNTSDFTDQRVVNLGRLLQSLDDDGNLENGIQITAEARTAATGMTVDFSVTAEVFEQNASIINLLAAGGGSVTLVSAEDAVSHMQDQLGGGDQPSLVGTWYVADEEITAFVTFFANGDYMLAESGEPDSDGQSGYEYGTYSWDPTTGVLSLELAADENGTWGLSHPLATAIKLTPDGDTLLLQELNGTTPIEGEDFTLSRLSSDTNPLVGAWTVNEQDTGDVAVIAFLPNGQYLLAEHGVSENGGVPGIEHGLFTWDAEQFVVGENIRDTNGDWGIATEGSFSLVVDGDTFTATFAADDIVTFNRVN